jgi:DNA polymerase III subunit chi
MTRIYFYFNVANKQQAIAKMVRAGIAKRRQITITVADAEAGTTLSAALWGASEDSFLPNVAVGSETTELTPVHLHWQDAPLYQDDMLINMHVTEPTFFSRFRHLVELVGIDETDKEQARKRFKFYRDRGYEIKSTDYAQDINQ